MLDQISSRRNQNQRAMNTKGLVFLIVLIGAVASILGLVLLGEGADGDIDYPVGDVKKLAVSKTNSTSLVNSSGQGNQSNSAVGNGNASSNSGSSGSASTNIAKNGANGNAQGNQNGRGGTSRNTENNRPSQIPGTRQNFNRNGSANNSRNINRSTGNGGAVVSGTGRSNSSGASGGRNSPAQLNPTSRNSVSIEGSNPDDAGDPNNLSNTGSVSVVLKNQQGEAIVGAQVAVIDQFSVSQPNPSETDGEGFASVQNIRRDRELQLNVQAHGYVGQQVPLALGRPLSVAVSLTLVNASSIRGVVKDNNNQAVVGANVVLAAGAEQWLATSDGAGAFEIFAPPGVSGQLSAECRGFARAQVDNASVDGPEVTLTMHNLSEAKVTVKIRPQSGAMPEEVRFDGQVLRPDNDGRINMTVPVTVPIRARQIYLEANNFKRHEFWVTPRTNIDIDLGEVELIPALSFYGEIYEVDSSGSVKPVGDLTVQSPDAPGLQVKTDPQGLFEIPDIPTPFILWIRADGHHQAHTIKIAAPNDPSTDAGFTPNRRRRIVLARGRYKLTLTVNDDKNEPLANVTVKYQNSEKVTDAQGQAVFDDVAQARGTAVLTHPEFLTLRRNNVESGIPPNEKSIVLTMTRGTILAGVVRAFNAPINSGAAVLIQAARDWDESLHGARPGPRSTPTDADGVYRFEGLSPGKYRLRVVGSTQAEKTITIEEGKTHSLDLDA